MTPLLDLVFTDYEGDRIEFAGGVCGAVVHCLSDGAEAGASLDRGQMQALRNWLDLALSHPCAPEDLPWRQSVADDHQGRLMDH